MPPPNPQPQPQPQGIPQSPSEPPSPKANDYIHSDEFLRTLMRRQLALSTSCAAAFLAALFGLPLLNYLAPGFMSQRVAGGFTLTWLALGVLSLPFVWIIAWVFIRKSIALEESEVRDARSHLDSH